MNPVSPSNDSLANSTKHMQWWLSVYNTACSIAIQKLSYARVRQLVTLDGIKVPLDEGDEFTHFHPKAPVQMQELLGSMTGLCRGAALANESVRVLFSAEGKSLNPVMYAATKLRPHSKDPGSEVKMTYAGVLTCCDYAEEDALSTVGASARLQQHVDDDVLDNNTAFVDIVCSTAKSRVGRALLAQFLIDLKRSRSRNPKEVVVTVAVSKEGRELFRSFQFSELKFKGSYLMFVHLQDVTFETMAARALQFEGSDRYMSVCFRHGLTRATSDKVYPTGCQ